MSLSYQNPRFDQTCALQINQDVTFRSHLLRAISQARLQQRPVIASVSFPVATITPFHLFAALQRLDVAHRFFWMHGQEFLVGAGAALAFAAQGADAHSILNRQWQKAADHIVLLSDEQSDETMPTFFAGFSFDPLARHKPSIWCDFPDGALILPLVMFRSTGDNLFLTINHPVSPDDTPGSYERAIEALLNRILHISASLPQDVMFPHESSFEYTDVLEAEQWKQLVSNASQAIQQQQLSKVVLARSMMVCANHPAGFDIPSLVYHLHQQTPHAHIFVSQFHDTAFVGAPPERLVAARAGNLYTMALAGSAPRGQTSEADQRIGQDLLTSHKNREEHAIVADTIMQRLAPLCDTLHRSAQPQLLQLPTIQHLQTPIWGQLRQEYSLLDAVTMLHPTPAVGGAPTDAALQYIREHEQMDRGWYAGPIGWLDLGGNGEFAVALRSGLVQGHTATLFAGCGIVADSQPESEYQESCLKFQVMLNGLRGQE